MTLLLLTILALLGVTPQALPMPTPGPEHKLLTMDQGTWDAIVELHGAPGTPAITSKGVEVNTIGCGGLCLVTDFKGDMGGVQFHGHGVTTWDAAKKKYVGSWTDSMSSGLSIAESTYEAGTRLWTGSMEGPDMTGKVVKMRTTVEVPNANTRVFTLFAPGPEGKEQPMMKISYTRRK